MPLRLLFQRRFGPLFVTQFCGAFNDNLFKNAVVLMVAFGGPTVAGLGPGLVINGIAALFILPFLLFSVTAGECADKWDKARLTRAIKLLEVALMTAGAAALVTQHLGAMLLVIFLLGCHSTFFGPVKFALLPQHLPPHQWSLGNGWIEMGTFTAILLGTNLGGILMGWGPAGRPWVAGAVLVVALAGYAASRAIPAAPPPSPELRFSANPLREAWRQLRMAARDRTLLVAMLGNSWFWCYGATFLTQLPVYTREVLGGAETLVTLLWTGLTLSVGTGSLLAGAALRGRWQWSAVPLGGLGMTLGACDLAGVQGPAVLPAHLPLPVFLHSALGGHVLLDTLGIGFSAGLYIVPLYSLIQGRTPVALRARVLGTTNLLNALFMVLSALGAGTLLGLGCTLPQLFLATGVLNALVLGGMVLGSPLLLRGERVHPPGP